MFKRTNMPSSNSLEHILKGNINWIKANINWREDVSLNGILFKHRYIYEQ